MGEHRGIKLSGPGDIRKAVQRITNKIFKEGSEVEHAAKLAQLFHVFLKAYEVEKLEDIESRLSAVEEGMKNAKS